MTDARAAADRLAHFYETLTPASLPALGRHYAADARFKDPFNEVAGVEAIGHIFAHMFATVEAPRFVISTRIVDGDQAMLGWDFHLRLRGRDIVVRGVSHLRFDAGGRVTMHCDYWDAAGELYARLPLVGALMRLLRRRLSAGAERA